MVNILLGIALAPQQFSRLKRTIFECGMESVEDGWRQMHVRYDLVAILFVIFAVEGVFLFCTQSWPLPAADPKSE